MAAFQAKLASAVAGSYRPARWNAGMTWSLGAGVDRQDVE
jgi:uncharacterized protein (DUF697 family)